MIRSMTAFASAEGASDLGTLSCELRSVNHRYLEPTLRLPEELRAFEPQVRERIAERLARGKIDVSVRVRGDSHAQGLEVDTEFLGHLRDLHEQILKALCWRPDPDYRVAALSRGAAPT